MTYPFHYDMPSVRIADSEIAVQRQCLDMIAKLFPNTRVAAVPNGQKRTVWQAQQAKKEGMSAGFPDLVIVSSLLSQNVQPLVAFPEIKALAPLTTDQRDWLTFMTDCGHHCGVFRSDRTLEAKMREWGFR